MASLEPAVLALALVFKLGVDINVSNEPNSYGGVEERKVSRFLKIDGWVGKHSVESVRVRRHMKWESR
jgi:hypothetical protein